MAQSKTGVSVIPLWVTLGKQTLVISRECRSLLVGTLLYMSPEQLQGKPFDLSWDLWAVAVMAYEMLTGHHPFARPTTTEWQSAVLTASFTPMSTYFPDGPTRWQEFFTRAFAINPPERPASARMFLSELEQALSEPVIAKPSRA